VPLFACIGALSWIVSRINADRRQHAIERHSGLGREKRRAVSCRKKLTAAKSRSTIVATRSQKGRPTRTMRATLAEAKADLRAIEKELGAR
jgi:hypothetical protein